MSYIEEMRVLEPSGTLRLRIVVDGHYARVTVHPRCPSLIFVSGCGPCGRAPTATEQVRRFVEAWLRR